MIDVPIWLFVLLTVFSVPTLIYLLCIIVVEILEFIWKHRQKKYHETKAPYKVGDDD